MSLLCRWFGHVWRLPLPQGFQPVVCDRCGRSTDSITFDFVDRRVLP